MHEKGEGPILESYHHEGMQPKGKNPLPIIIAVLILTMGLGAFFFISKTHSEEAQEIDFEEVLVDKELDSDSNEVMSDQLSNLRESLENEAGEKEEGTVDFFYKRALDKESKKDYAGAVEDYTRTIEKAKKYSAEMWNALNNRGIIKAQQLKDYRGARKDFDKIISIELNRYDSEINETRLEAGYTNRAYVKKMQGDVEGACDDLYEALSLGIESSSAFIEKQIDKNCL